MPYRIRTVRIGLQTTALVLFVLAPIAILSGDERILVVPLAILIGLTALGAVWAAVLPWERLFATGKAMKWLYVWSVADIAGITTLLAYAGPDKPNFFFLYVFTTIFFAASYPRRGQAGLFLLTVASYLAVWMAFSEGEPFSRAAFRVSALAIAAFMASFMSRELMQQITAHQLAREELRVSREELQRKTDLYESLLQAQSDLGEGVCIADLSTQKLKFVNDALSDMYGYAKEEMLDLPSFFRLFAPGERERLEPKVEERLRGKRTSDHDEVTVVRKDGKILHVEAAHKPLDDRHLIVLTRDISDRWKAARETARSMSLLKSTLESTTNGILAVDTEGRMVTYNEKFVNMWRLPSEVMISRDDARALEAVLDQLPDPTSFLSKVQALHGSDRESFDIVELKDGRTFEVYSIPQRLGGSDGEIVGRVWSFADVTGRRAAEMNLAESHKALIKADREKRRLLTHLVRAKEEERKRVASDIHDDSIQVMTIVAMGLERLAKKAADPHLKEVITHLEETTRDAVSRLRAMVFELRPPSLDEEGLGAALRLYLEELRVETGITYVFNDDLETDLPPALRSALYRVAQEALTNVRKHANASKVSVFLSEVDGDVRLRVEDDGVGLSMRTDAIGAIRHIGLPEMRERVEIAGGTLDILSAPGEGTIVEAKIPLSVDPTASAASRTHVV